MKLIICPVEKTANHHDCWLYHKPTKRLFYVPFGHHYQLFDYLVQHGYEDVMAGEWGGKSDNNHIKTGDIKHGTPRTVNENVLTHKTLSKIIVDAYHSVRNIIPTQETIYELGKNDTIIQFMENEKPKTPKKPPPKLKISAGDKINPEDLNSGDVFKGWKDPAKYIVVNNYPQSKNIIFRRLIPSSPFDTLWNYKYCDMFNLTLDYKAVPKSPSP